MDSSLTASDIALLDNGAMGGSNSFLWIFALLILANGGLGGWGYNRGGIGDYATAASQQEILFGQQFQNIDNKIDRLGNGIADATFALNNSITTEGRNIQSQLATCCCENQKNVDSVRFDMANYAAQTNANTTAQIQKVLDVLAQNKIETLQGRVNQLELQNAVSGVVRYPMQTTYTSGANPFCNCNCNCNNI